MGWDMELGQYCIIDPTVKIGIGTRIGHFVILKKHTCIGNNCTIEDRVISSGKNWIGDETTLKYGCVIARATQIGKYCFLAPNVVTLYLTADGECKPVRIGDNVFIGAGTIIAPGVTICSDAVIGALSFVNKDITEPGIYAGSPVKRIR